MALSPRVWRPRTEPSSSEDPSATAWQEPTSVKPPTPLAPAQARWRSISQVGIFASPPLPILRFFHSRICSFHCTRWEVCVFVPPLLLCSSGHGSFFTLSSLRYDGGGYRVTFGDRKCCFWQWLTACTRESCCLGGTGLQVGSHPPKFCSWS